MKIDPRLRGILDTGRQAAGRLSQRAAASRAGISHVYWQKIEAGTVDSVPADTLATMFSAIGVSAQYLRDEGYTDVADTVDALTRATRESSPEEYLAATPGASAEEITALQAVWRALKAKRTAEPAEHELSQNSRNRTGHTRPPSTRTPQDSRR